MFDLNAEASTEEISLTETARVTGPTPSSSLKLREPKALKTPKAKTARKATKKAKAPKKAAITTPTKAAGKKNAKTAVSIKIDAGAVATDRTKAGSKGDLILGMIWAEGGATLDELMKAAGWQRHSVRGFIAGTVGKKLGLTVISSKDADGSRRYEVKK